MTTTDADALHAERYRIAASRDARFDGQFVTAVHSTGIYCRPSCPARTPRSSGVTFYPTSAAAHLAGYRACKRCLPEATPGSPEWDLREDVASRAMRLVLDGVVERDGVPGLAARVGYSERHLTRIMTEHLGAGPKALSRAHRAQTARTLLMSSDLSVADIAFASGFASIRQFNDTVREVFAVTPSQLRARRRVAPTRDGSLRVHLPARAPFDVQGLLDWHAFHALPGVEQVTTDHTGTVRAYARVVDLPGGPGWFSASATTPEPTGRRVGLDLQIRLTDLADLPALITRVRALFDLDADPEAVDGVLGGVPELSPAVERVPGMRLPGSVSPAEVVIRTLIGQQVSVAAARTAQSRLVDALGGHVDDAIAPGGRTFPTPDVIARDGRSVLRGPEARIDTILRVSAALADGSLGVDPSMTLDDLRAGLLAQRGIGPWTADYVALRVRHHPDLLLASDLAVRNGAQMLGLPGGARDLSTWSERVAPWRSYLTMHCWRMVIDRAMTRTQLQTSRKAPK